MKQKEQLTGFLIRRLVMVLLFVAVSQSLISLFFTTVLYPFINSYLHIDILQIVNATSSSPFTIARSLLWFVSLGISNVLPAVLRAPFRALTDRLSTSGWEDYLSQISAKDQIKTSLVLSLVLLFGLVIYLLPYIFATIVYSKWIVQEVAVLRKQDAIEREAFEQQRNLLLSDIAHDLKTPITTISGYANALKDHVVTEDAKKEEYLKAISVKSIQMSQLINLLFQYVTLDSEGFKLNCSRENLIELLMETVAANYTDIEAAGMELEMDVPEIPILTSLDKIQFSRAVANLIQNAVRHNPEGTVILISVMDLYDHVIIDIADSGEPIEESIREHLFDPFVMGDDSRTHRGGSGLGLSIAAKIMELHGGELALIQPYEKAGQEVGYTKSFHLALPL
ncbi:MAG: HAMP domain-containing sensor histidine kinase [Hespellia sp.]|nr:HAMP domain-containing sensor histidine kinase [Hespellia sp.]